ncbi:MAG: hypothetical protein LRY38_09230 [Aeromonadaceae bacterium]|nr:hypothetical protein [Aeromonadaceae bacterium]
MITLLPMEQDQVAKHFTKAPELLFIDEQGKSLGRVANPALDSDCAGKQALLDLMTTARVDRVLVRGIGQQMLGKLLARKLLVQEITLRQARPEQLANPQMAGLLTLTDASQGKPSINHAAKGACCHHQADMSAEQACCKQGHGPQGAGKKCCQH